MEGQLGVAGRSEGKQWQVERGFRLKWVQKAGVGHRQYYRVKLPGRMKMGENANEEEWGLMEQRGPQSDDSYGQNDGEYQLVAQYLSLTPSSFIEGHPSDPENPKIDPNCSPKPEQPSNGSSSTQQPSFAKKKPSSLHNFQKHLSTTLKRCIKIKKGSNSNRSRSSIANQLWEQFVSAPQSSKRSICCLLLGGRTGWSGNEKYEKEYGRLVAQFSEYSECEIASAQEYLRKEVLRQSQLLLQSPSFRNRRISNAQHFAEYFRAFLQQLSDCNVSLRFPKHHPAPTAPKS